MSEYSESVKADVMRWITHRIVRAMPVFDRKLGIHLVTL